MASQNNGMRLNFPSEEEIRASVAEWEGKLVGKYIKDDVREDPNDLSAVPGSSIVKVSELPKPIRVIRPGSRVTRDLCLNRMNVKCDGTGKITGIAFH